MEITQRYCELKTLLLSELLLCYAFARLQLSRMLTLLLQNVRIIILLSYFCATSLQELRPRLSGSIEIVEHADVIELKAAKSLIVSEVYPSFIFTLNSFS